MLSLYFQPTLTFIQNLSLAILLHFQRSKWGHLCNSDVKTFIFQLLFKVQSKLEWWRIHEGGGPGGFRLSVDSTTFLQIFYNQQKNSKSTILHDFLKKLVDSTII